MTDIHPQHQSVRGLKRNPRNMSVMPGFTVAQSETLERVALDIFGDMANAGRSFQEALGAIYLSGMAHAVSVLSGDT